MKNWWESWFIIEDTTLIFPNITSGLVANQYIFINNRLCLSTEVVGDTMHDNPLLADHLLRDNTFWNRHDLRFTYPVNWKCLLHSLAESIGTDSVLASAIVLYRKERNSPFCKRQPTQFFASFVDHTGCQRAHRRCGKLFWWHFLYFCLLWHWTFPVEIKTAAQGFKQCARSFALQWFGGLCGTKSN